MSKLKVDELDTRSGSTITVAAGKTLAGTDIIDTAQIKANAVDTNEIAANAVTLAEMAGLARGKIIIGDSSGDPSALATGTSGQFLTTDGTDTSWGAVVAGTSWQAVQTAAFTAVSGNGYPCNTTAAEFTVTLPASASVGDWVEIVDYAGTFDTNKITLDPNGLKIKGATDNLQLSLDREAVVITYIDVTQGWVATSSRTSVALAPLEYDIDYLVIGGAGGGGFGQSVYQAGGGGGAGGYRTSTQAHTSSTGVITITVGDGAAGLDTIGQTPVAGSPSSISASGLTTITSAGGGGGAGYNSVTGGTGGSGGGGGSPAGPGGTGNSPVTSPVQGYNGGAAAGSGAGGGPRSGGGGGGSSAIGTNASGSTGGNGGNGTASSITGSAVTRAGGGGGGAQGPSYVVGAAGTGGAGAGSNNSDAADGTVNTGSGGGGASNYNTPTTYAGGNGGKGVVILSMSDGSYSGNTTGSPTIATNVSGKTILTFTGTGSYTG